MVRSAKLKLALLAALVLAGHFIALEWLGRQADVMSRMPAMAPPMFTRMLRPARPPPVVAAPAPPAVPKARVASRPKPAASAPSAPQPQQAKAQPAPEPVAAAELPVTEAPVPSVAEAPTPAASSEVLAEVPALAASAAVGVAEPPVPAASAAVAIAPEAPASAPASATALDTWPTDTRLTYNLSGQWRGPLYGDAHVQWQREGDKYQARLDVGIQVFGTQLLTSQGEVTPDGLIPRAYEELRPGKRRFAQFGDEVLMFENGKTAPRPPGVQDTVSQFVELTHRFATGRDVLEVGRSVSIWLARPNSVDRWTYDIVALELLSTPKLGLVEAYHLKPRPIANPRGNITAEMWFAPSLLYLPVRIKVLMGTEANLDLLVEQIEQR